MGFQVVIPARHASTRLPGKPLCMIAGKTMIERVHARAAASGAASVVVATDDRRVADAVARFGGTACMTAATHESGTARIAEVIERMGWASDVIVVNVQGDEPLLPPQLVSQVADNLAARPAVAIATLCVPIEEPDDVFNPNVVKVVRDARGLALYFSRAPIPWERDAFAAGQRGTNAGRPHLRHIGLYAYRAGFVRDYVALPPSPLEEAESLEQLRALAHGHAIHVDLARVRPGPGVDTEADRLRVEQEIEHARC